MKIVSTCALAMALLAATACSHEHPSEEGAQTAQQPLRGSIDTTKSGAVALLRGNSSNLVLLADTCSAALIAPNLALTARHCVEFLTSSTGCSATFTGSRSHGYFAIRTEADVSGAGTPFVVAQIRKPTKNAACEDDLALLILETSVPSAMLAPIVPRLTAPPMAGATYSAIGYGTSSADADSTDGLRRRADGSQVVCAGDCGGAPFLWFGAPSSACPGDSGGPALDPQGGVIGVLSRGSCGDVGGVDIYTRTDAHAALIVAAAKEAAILGGYPSPPWAVVPPSKDAGADADGAPRADAGVAPSDAASTDPDEAPTVSTPALPKEVAKDGCSVGRVGAPTPAWPLALLMSVLVALRILAARSGSAGMRVDATGS